jgi:hypothetical protein
MRLHDRTTTTADDITMKHALERSRAAVVEIARSLGKH